MDDTKISDLPLVVPSSETMVLASGNNQSTRITVDGIAEAVKKSLGYLERPLVKCRHCGQWGAAYCACRYCGAPIDP